MAVHFDDEKAKIMVCRNCLYRKYDQYIEDIFLEGFSDSACAKYLRKPSSIFEYGGDCKFYTEQKEGDELIWASEKQGLWYMQSMLERIRELLSIHENE